MLEILVHTILPQLYWLVGLWLLYKVLNKYVKPWVHASPARLWVFIKIGAFLSFIGDKLHKKFTMAIWDDVFESMIHETLKALDIEVGNVDKLRDAVKKNMGFTLDNTASQKDIENTED